ncbi:MAG: CofH family radical SAM protein [Parachlamydiales bacterium]
MSKRLSIEEGIRLLTEAPLEELRERAVALRNARNPPKRVTFVLDSNPNYTNLCNADCSFCAFYRHSGAKDAYQKNLEESLEHVALAAEAGCSTVMFQGGLADYPLSFYTSLVRETLSRYPTIYPHYFTAPEIWNCARVNNLSIRDVLEALYDAGQRSLPGGGAEILTERVRTQISPKKMAPGAWIEIHKTAHQIGMRSTATMMYGHVEEARDIVEHLDTLRSAQDEIPGFTAFIPWSYKRERTALRRKVKHWAGLDVYLRILAFSRIYLDNFDHIQFSPIFEGLEGQKAIHYGADDAGGIVLEENVHRATGFNLFKARADEMIGWIRSAGYEPAERNPLYEILRTFENYQAPERNPLALA